MAAGEGGGEGAGGGAGAGVVVGGASVAAETHEAARAMYEEDIDAILARAEVVDNTQSQVRARKERLGQQPHPQARLSRGRGRADSCWAALTWQRAPGGGCLAAQWALRFPCLLQAQEEGPGGELLSSFNVATFKNEEDDAAFWSRLIPVAERPPDEDAQVRSVRCARTACDTRTPGAPAACAGSRGVAFRAPASP